MNGPGKIEYYDIGGALVVNQTADVIREVQDLLESLRRLQETSVSVEIRVISLSEAFFERVSVAAGGAEAEATVPLAAPLATDGGLADALGRLGEELEASKDGVDRDLALELSARARSCAAMAENVREAAGGPDDAHASWIESDTRGNAAVVRAPVDAGPHLRRALFDAYPTVVLTSATLAVGRPPSFSYTRERLGLESHESVDELALGSPFDFRRQARIVVRTDLPDPAREPRRYEDALPAAVLDAVRRTEGGAFVLFTAYGSMRRVVAAVRGELEADGLQVLVQGESLPRTAMLEGFRATDSVLFGVSSFWQGVDVPGDALRNVVIARLPFDVPTHPLAKAREARLRAAGKSPFEHLSLPHAALRLKQGFGRLIRRATDRGLVVILDPRVVTKRYGKALLDSLPPCPVDLESLDEAEEDGGDDQSQAAGDEMPEAGP